jgi:hypothetical protein
MNILLTLCLSNYVSAWGDLGHRTVALVARKYLTTEASQVLDDILANDQGYDFSDAATWADTIKRGRPETKEWHYVGKNIAQSWSFQSLTFYQTHKTRHPRRAGFITLKTAKTRAKMAASLLPYQHRLQPFLILVRRRLSAKKP